jgi:hypothetical protein
MLNGITYTPALEAKAAPIFATLPEPLAAQLAREMVRLAATVAPTRKTCGTFGEKLTALRGRMAYFSTASVTRSAMGRPLGEPTATFAALLFARLSGYSRKRATELLAANPDAASGAIWSVAAHAHREGVQTAEQFEAWLQREDAKQEPVTL